jgi:hypothetical protein
MNIFKINRILKKIILLYNRIIDQITSNRLSLFQKNQKCLKIINKKDLNQI